MTHVGILVAATPGHGGTFQYTLSMIEALSRLEGNSYTIFSPHDTTALEGFGMPTVRLPRLPSALARRLLGGSRTHGADPLFRNAEKVIAPISSPYLALSTVPFCFTLHDLQERHYPQYFTLAQRVWRHVWNAVLTARAKRIICESQFVKGDIIRWLGVDEEKIAVVPAPPISVFGEEEPTLTDFNGIRERFGLGDEFLFYPANFWPHKNHRRLVEAFGRVGQRHPKCQLVLSGSDGWDFKAVFELVGRRGLEDQVKHIGYVSTRDLQAIYRLATLVVVPTLFESISIPIYEAFALGKAVCASRVVGIPEQVGDAGLLFDPMSVEDIAAKILTLLEDEGLRNRLGRLGRERIAAVTHDRYAAELGKVLAAVKG